MIEKQITSAIQLLNPLGVRFIPLVDWNFKTVFHQNFRTNFHINN
ncbi:hypothetical protein LEP1GSC021_3382 [Leptospira noguchii str. 1993005606]|uniref:Uncharacterized protein n=1 Tax=Leptospira noguchii str. 2001034031 TaxID=1193053 RepID=M6Y977_9LEPT|nr:hypothetical protein LEP1GSC024_3683 [Leptospira noguchii str. 2001034031]EPE86247.1 hypothetical protein LEP1GSC021_3382 [Leptospira noguchii str. 1993005606]